MYHEYCFYQDFKIIFAFCHKITLSVFKQNVDETNNLNENDGLLTNDSISIL